MGIKLEAAKKIFYATGSVAIVGGIFSLFYYAYLMPLHVDEAGWWFNYTNKSYQYRFIPNNLDPNHTLTIYLAKISLWLFGNTGIGLRFPVIIFGILSVGIFYIFVRKVTNSGVTGAIAAALLFLNPFFLHYSHELRGYSAYFFLLVCCYLCFMRLLEKDNRFINWALLFILFAACYVSNLAAPIFFFTFLATLWIITISRKFIPIGGWVEEFKNIKTGSLFLYSVIAASFFVFIMFYVDRFTTLHQLVVHNKESNYLAIPDLFSTFLGYRYLDDPTSTLYSYPIIIWLISLTSFLYGWWSFVINRSWQASFFLLMFFLNSLFYIFIQTWIPLRSSIYLLPFALLFQAHGLKNLVAIIVKRFSFSEYQSRDSYLILSGILICYFSFFSIGKHQNFEPKSDNPFELARSYLEKNIGPNDLIISSLYDTKASFYLGHIILRNNRNIYQNGSVENIYYLSPKTGESKIELQMMYPDSKKSRFFPLKQFELKASYENKGVRPSVVNIFKRRVDTRLITQLDKNQLSIPNYFGNHGKDCKTTTDNQGVRIKCEQSPMACARQALTFKNIAKNDFQFLLFNHTNDKGTQAVSAATMKSMDPTLFTEQTGKERHKSPIPHVYKVNPLVNEIDDLDIYRKGVNVIDISLQKMGGGNDILFCMVGKLFEDNSILNGVKVFNLKP